MTDLATILDGHSDLVTVCLVILLIVLAVLAFKLVVFLISLARDA